MLWTIIVFVAAFQHVHGSPGGAPDSACDSMTPSHGSVVAQSGASSYTITLSAQTYRCGETITVTLAGDTFKGFLCQARTNVANYDSVVGTLAQSGSVSMNQRCGGNGLTHSENGDKNTAVFTWAPSANHGSVQIVCTIVKAKVTYWVKEASSTLTYDGGCTNSAGHPWGTTGLYLLALIPCIMGVSQFV